MACCLHVSSKQFWLWTQVSSFLGAKSLGLQPPRAAVKWSAVRLRLSPEDWTLAPDLLTLARRPLERHTCRDLHSHRQAEGGRLGPASTSSTLLCHLQSPTSKPWRHWVRGPFLEPRLQQGARALWPAFLSPQVAHLWRHWEKAVSVCFVTARHR